MNIGTKISVIAAILQEDLEEYQSLKPYLKEAVIEEINGCLVKLKPMIDSLVVERVEEMLEGLAKAEPVLTVEATPPVLLPLKVNGLEAVPAKSQVKAKEGWTPIRFPQYFLKEGTPVFDYLINETGAVYNQSRHKLLKDIERSKGMNRAARVSIYCIDPIAQQPRSNSIICALLMLYTFGTDEDRRRIDSESL